MRAGPGGLVVSTGTVTLAPGPADVTLVTIGQNGSALDAHQLIVGLKGNASLNLADRGTLFSDNILLGDEAGSTGSIDLRSSSAIVQDADDNMIVGFGSGSRGFLEMTDSTFDTGALEIGFGGEGEVKVGSNSTVRVFGTSRSPLYVGVSARGRLIIEGGGSVRRENSAKTTVGLLGEVDVRDGHLHENNELHVDGRFAITAASGSASIGRNSVATPGVLTVGPGGNLRGTGVIFANVRVLSGGTSQFSGVVQPANSPGTLTIDGSYEQPGGRLDIEVAGTAPGQFDVLAVTGNATLGGELLLEFIEGFAPRQGDEFKFLDVGGALIGAFDSVAIRNLAPGFQFDLRADAGGLTMVALNDGVFLVPEPATFQMLFAGVLAICFRRRAAMP